MRILPLPDPRRRPPPAAHRTGMAASQVRYPENGTGGKDPSAALAVWPSTQYARGSPARPSGIRANIHGPPVAGTQPAPRGKVCLKSNTSQHLPQRGRRPHGRQDHRLHAGAEPGSAGHPQHPRQNAGTANAPRQEHRSPGAGRPDGAAAAAQRQREPERQACSQGTGNGVEVMQVGMVSVNGLKWVKGSTVMVEPFTLKRCPAVTYSPTPSRVQYHRRCGS